MLLKKKNLLGFSNCVAVDCQGRSAGLALLWITEVQVTIRNYSSMHIHATIEDNILSQSSWDFTGIYGYPESSNKYKTWERIRTLHPQSQDKWLVCGDFNKIMFQDEKGGRRKAESLLSDICSMTNDCELANLGIVGAKFCMVQQSRRRSMH